ncbi:MAG TPA: winged helix-turn-helix domain-containing protein, partial [Chloroflexota bacterium]|nr:winged helix-turn-helix domain-containing protein [Chloroflexota bacterium]
AAVDIIDHQALDLIVADSQAPTVDGWDFFRTLVDHGCSVAVVVMASSNAAEVAQKVGAAGYLDKPFTVFQARATTTAALQRHDTNSSSIVQTEQDQALRVLVFTSQRFLAQMIKLTLDHGVYVTRAGNDVVEAAAIIRDWRPQLVVADLDSDGGDLLNQIGLDRAAGSMPLPMVAVTRSRELRTKLSAFEQGVDDVLIVPIAPEELLARVVAIMRRTFGQTFPLKPILLHEDLEIDIVNHRVRVGSSEVRLTDTEQSLLYLLAANAGEVVTAEEIRTAVWGVDESAEHKVVESLVVSLRDKLQNGWKEPRFIATYPGVGYRFKPVGEQLAGMS